MTIEFGIEDIAVYPGTMALDIAELCRIRGTDFEEVQRTLMTDFQLLSSLEDCSFLNGWTSLYLCVMN